MNDISPREFGALQATVESLERDMADMKADVRVIRDAITEARGGWKTLLAIGGAAASVSAGVTWALQHLTFK
jgi:hypothetical protein